MSFTRSTTNTSVHQGLPDYPTGSGYSATTLKQTFDAPAEGLQADINNLEQELEATTAAESLGAAAVYEGDSSNDTIQDKLEMIYAAAQSTTLGQIPDDSITESKLVQTYATTLAKNAGMGKLYLASQYRTPAITNTTMTSWTVPQLTESSHTGYTATWNAYSTSGVTSPYNMFRGDGNSYMVTGRYNYSSEYSWIVLALPNPTRISKVVLKVSADVNLWIKGSANGTTWTKIGQIDYDSNRSSVSTITVNISDQEFYSYIRIEQKTYGDGGTSSQNNFRIYNNISIQGNTVPNVNQNTMTITASETNEVLSAYENGMIVKITTPSSYLKGKNLVPTLNIYSLGAKQVPNDMEASKRYSLVYDGTKFVHE